MKTRQPPATLDLCLKKTRTGKLKSHHLIPSGDIIVFEKLLCQKFSVDTIRKTPAF